jgi:hypothetical protein
MCEMGDDEDKIGKHTHITSGKKYSSSFHEENVVCECMMIAMKER